MAEVIKCPICGSVLVYENLYNPDDHGIHWVVMYRCYNCGRKKENNQWDSLSRDERIIIEKNKRIAELENEIKELKAR